MRHLNLLPWREEERRVRNNIFFVQLGGAFVLACIILVLGHIAINGWINIEQNNINYLTKETGVSKIESKEVLQLEENRRLLIERIKVIQSLEADRSSLVQLFDTIPRAIPNGVYLTEMSNKSNVILLSGVADNNPSISAFIKSLESFAWVSEVRLVEVASDKMSSGLTFKLQFTEHPEMMEST